MIIPDGPDQQTGSRFARNERRARVSTLEPSGPTVQPKSTLEWVRILRMAFVTVLGQNRPDFVLKKVETFAFRNGRGEAYSQDERNGRSQCRILQIGDHLMIVRV